MEFGNSQVRETEEASEVLVEDDTDKVIEASGELQRNSSIRGSNIGSGSLNPINVEDGVEVNQDGSFEEDAAMAAAVTAGAAVGAAAATEKPPPRQVVVDEGLPPEGINNNNNSQTRAKNTTTTNYPADDQCCTVRYCAYPNGAFPIMFAQFFLFCGLMLSTWSVIDCKFVVATAGYPEPYYPQSYIIVNGVQTLVTPNVTDTLPPSRRGFGFIFNETLQGGCGFTDDSRYFTEEELQNYFDFLGSDWDIPRLLVSVASVGGWVLWWFLLLPMVCCSYIRAARWMLALIVILVVGGLQSSSFAVISSSFCDEEADCQPDRGLWIAVAGISMYLFAGLFFCMMTDFPGAIAAD